MSKNRYRRIYGIRRWQRFQYQIRVRSGIFRKMPVVKLVLKRHSVVRGG